MTWEQEFDEEDFDDEGDDEVIEVLIYFEKEYMIGKYDWSIVVYVLWNLAGSML